MPQSLAHLLRSGILTRTKLREMLQSASAPPRVDPGLYNGLMVRAQPSGDIISLRSRAPRLRQKEIDARITGSTLFAPNRWNYTWAEARISGTTLAWETLPGGRTSATLGQARNKAEALNTGTVVAHGVVIPTPPPTITLLAIPTNTPVTIRLLKDVADVSRPWFSEVNAINVVC